MLWRHFTPAVVAGTFVVAAVLGAQGSNTAQVTGSPLPMSVEELATRVSVLETQVADSQAQLGSPVGSAAVASPVATPVIPLNAESSAVYGNAWEFLGSGVPGEVSVVASGVVQGYSIPIIVRNNTDKPKAYVQVGAEARDGNGSLIAVGRSYQFLPIILPPGEFAVGGIGFNGQELPTGGNVSFDVSASDDIELYS